jgi:hypothetical protein
MIWQPRQYGIKDHNYFHPCNANERGNKSQSMLEELQATTRLLQIQLQEIMDTSIGEGSRDEIKELIDAFFTSICMKVSATKYCS